jgi:hypothetical protein
MKLPLSILILFLLIYHFFGDIAYWFSFAYDAIGYAAYMMWLFRYAIICLCVMTGIGGYFVFREIAERRGEDQIEVNHQRRRY